MGITIVCMGITIVCMGITIVCMGIVAVLMDDTTALLDLLACIVMLDDKIAWCKNSVVVSCLLYAAQPAWNGNSMWLAP